MIKMRTNIIYLAFLVFLFSCSASNDKKKELEQLKASRQKLDAQISKIQAEVNPAGTNKEEKAITVKVEEIKACTFNHYVEVQGIVDGDQNVAVSPQTAGIITNVYVREGSQVKRGQVLAELDAQVLKQSLDEIKTQLELASNLYEKQKALWDKKIGSEVQFLQAKTNKESLEKRARTLQGQIDMTRITSPISGTVESVPLKVGQMASPGLPTSSIRVINMSTAKITADVSENYAAKVKNGNSVIVRFPDLGKEIESKLTFTSRYIDPTNRTFRVECKISDRDAELRANMVAYVKIKDYTNDNAFCVPANFIQSNQDGKFLFVAVQNGSQWTAARRMVKTGMDYNGTSEILGGIALGDKVITAGFQNLKDGDPVIIQ
jgi:RND family efflux transporter MFP subunit